jgi:lipopolysaccharide export system ATP-binding protein
VRKKGIETLETIDLTKAYNGRIVVDRVSLKIRAGEVVGLLGPNGAGKTTTFYMIIGLVRPDRGKVLFNGEDIGELPMYQRARKGITYLPQEPSVFRKLTVEENILAILETLNLVREDQERRLQGFLKELNIAHLAKNKAYSLSGGERRRVEITRALVLSPSLILLDEPFAGIDPLAVIDIQNIIRQLKKRGIGVIVTDHNVREALHVCDRAYILNEGKILEVGSPKKIAASKKAREIYLGEHFKLERRRGHNGKSKGESPEAQVRPVRQKSKVKSTEPQMRPGRKKTQEKSPVVQQKRGHGKKGGEPPKPQKRRDQEKKRAQSQKAQKR